MNHKNIYTFWRDKSIYALFMLAYHLYTPVFLVFYFLTITHDVLNKVTALPRGYHSSRQFDSYRCS